MSAWLAGRLSTHVAASAPSLCTIPCTVPSSPNSLTLSGLGVSVASRVVRTFALLVYGPVRATLKYFGRWLAVAPQVQVHVTVKVLLHGRHGACWG